MRHLIDPMDLSVEDIDRLLDRADDIAKNPEKYQEVCKHKKLATLFFEPSTRTRLSFEAAMLELGGSVLGFSSADSSSASKGESVADTARVIECYADIIAMRHIKNVKLWHHIFHLINFCKCDSFLLKNIFLQILWNLEFFWRN